jgi:hypothetical protein
MARALQTSEPRGELLVALMQGFQNRLGRNSHRVNTLPAGTAERRRQSGSRNREALVVDLKFR